MSAPAAAPVASPAARLRHDLRTPVNHILGYGEMLIEDAEASGRMDRLGALTRIRETAREMIQLIDAVPTTFERLGAALRDPAYRVLVELDELRHAGAPLGPGEGADLQRITDAAGVLLRLADHRVAVGTTAEAVRPPAPRADRLDDPIGRTPSARILVVDDDPANRELLARRLEREGHLVVFAADGPQALALLDSDGPDLVLLDVMMPGMDGDEVLRRLRADPRHDNLPVLMISALDEQDAVVRCLEIGADDYLPKGVDPVLLRTRIGACLKKKRLRDQELAYLRHVRLLTAAAATLQTSTFDDATIEEVARRPDTLGNLARVFRDVAREVRTRELRLTAQVAQLRIEIDDAKKSRAVSEIVETDYFQDLQRRAAELRRPLQPR
ncbi:MAG: response regulator [Gemmatimonadales bacterium]